MIKILDEKILYIQTLCILVIIATVLLQRFHSKHSLSEKDVLATFPQCNFEPEFPGNAQSKSENMLSLPVYVWEFQIINCGIFIAMLKLTIHLTQSRHPSCAAACTHVMWRFPVM